MNDCERRFTNPKRPIPVNTERPINFRLPGGSVEFSFITQYGERQTAGLTPIKCHNDSFLIICQETRLTLNELHFLSLKGNHGLADKSIARILGLGYTTIRNELYAARERNPSVRCGDNHNSSIYELVFRAEMLGLIHPELLPYIQDTFLLPANLPLNEPSK